jgi:hypothetical protein
MLTFEATFVVGILHLKLIYVRSNRNVMRRTGAYAVARSGNQMRNPPKRSKILKNACSVSAFIERSTNICIKSAYPTRTRAQQWLQHQPTISRQYISLGHYMINIKFEVKSTKKLTSISLTTFFWPPTPPSTTPFG